MAKAKTTPKETKSDKFKETTKAHFRIGLTLSKYGRINAGSEVTPKDREAFKTNGLTIEDFIK